MKVAVKRLGYALVLASAGALYGLTSRVEQAYFDTGDGSTVFERKIVMGAWMGAPAWTVREVQEARPTAYGWFMRDHAPRMRMSQPAEAKAGTRLSFGTRVTGLFGEVRIQSKGVGGQVTARPLLPERVLYAFLVDEARRDPQLAERMPRALSAQAPFRPVWETLALDERLQTWLRERYSEEERRSLAEASAAPEAGRAP